MVFRYPFFDPMFFAWFSPLLICVITTHCFAKPRLRPWWLAVISSSWLIFCLILAYLVFMEVACAPTNTRYARIRQKISQDDEITANHHGRKRGLAKQCVVITQISNGLNHAYLVFVGAQATSMNPTEYSPYQYVVVFAGGWLFSGLICIWAPEFVRRL